jgi:type II secretory pathway component PulF
MEEQPSQTVAPAVPVQSPSTVIPPVRHIPKGIIILLLFIFAPLAVYFMYKDKRYHVWFSYVMLIFSVVGILTTIINVLFVFPQLATLYNSLNAKTPSFTGVFIKYGVLIVLYAIEIIIGLKLNKEIQKNDNYRKFLKISVGILLFDYFFGGYLFAYNIIVTVLPVYNIIGSIQ